LFSSCIRENGNSNILSQVSSPPPSSFGTVSRALTEFALIHYPFRRRDKGCIHRNTGISEGLYFLSILSLTFSLSSIRSLTVLLPVSDFVSLWSLASSSKCFCRGPCGEFNWMGDIQVKGTLDSASANINVGMSDSLCLHNICTGSRTSIFTKLSQVMFGG